jgi:hypothetical protein
MVGSIKEANDIYRISFLDIHIYVYQNMMGWFSHDKSLRCTAWKEQDGLD